MSSENAIESTLLTQPQTRKSCLSRIKLNQGISWRHFIGCLIHYFMLSYVFVSVDSLQPMLLQQRYNVDRKQGVQNMRNALVIAFDILVKILLAPVFGYLADRTGRFFINFFGIIIIGFSMMMMPYCGSFEMYIICRCIYAVGAIAISVVPLLADYVAQNSRGTCAAILVFMSSIGAVTSAQINFSILANIQGNAKIHMQYGVISTSILILGFLYNIICVKKGNTYYLKDKKNRTKSSNELIAVFKKTLKHPQISTGYLSAFLARSDSILLSLYLVLWVYSFKQQHDQKNYDQSSKTASMLSGITYAIIMFSSIVYGILYERKNVNKRNVMLFMLTLAFGGSLLMNFSTQIFSVITYISLCVLGIGMSGLLTSSLYLVNQYSSQEHRGYITGIQTIFGVVGIVFQTVIGAVLYQVFASGPFAYFSFTCLCVIFFTYYIYKKVGSSTNRIVIKYDQITQNKQSTIIE